MTTDPKVSEPTTPEPSAVTEPEPNTVSEPDASTATDPEPSTESGGTTNVPESSTTTATDTSTTTQPEPTTATEPAASTGTAPDASTGTEPKANAVTEPNSSTATAPETDSVTEPTASTASGPEANNATDPKNAAVAQTGEFEGVGSRIAWRAWLPDDRARAVIVLVHGVAEHSGRYAHVGKRLADNGFAVYALDHLGHGKSAGSNANIGSMEGAADNVAGMLKIASREHPDVPKFLLAHSMGSLITLYLATRGPIDVAGIVVSAPPLDIAVGNPLQRALGPLLSRIAPNLGVLKLDSSMISRDPEVIRAYDSDPLVFRGKLPARTGMEMLHATDVVKGRLDALTVPLLVLHGTADSIAAPSSSDVIEQRAGSEDLTVIRYEGLYHEVFNEPEQEKVLSDVVEWLDAHVSGG